MPLTQIIFAGLGSVLFHFFGKKWEKEKVLYVANVFFLFLLQPITSIRYLQFILPWLTIFLVISVGWAISKNSDKKFLPKLLLLSFLGFSPFLLSELIPGTHTFAIYRNINPRVLWITILIFSVLFIGFSRIKKEEKTLPFFLLLILLIFLALKQPQISLLVSKGLRSLFNQNVELASNSEIRWIGYSYIAFRLIHAIREYQKGRLKDVSVISFANYCLFFPSLSAGPIAKYDDFSSQMETPKFERNENIMIGSERLMVGLFKKFVIADSLAMLALNPTNAAQFTSQGWVWLALFFYSLQIYFDFSGYTDIAIGLGLFLGIKLPENFDKPYLKSNLTKFWDSWHMTLAQWIRSYYFNPLNRALRKSKLAHSQSAILLITQVTTMVLIGLWHGVTWTFLVWGLWHGIGLFIQNRWSALIRNMGVKVQQKKILNTIVTSLSTVITFVYVTVGWVWFLSPTLQDALQLIQKMAGKGF